MSEMVKIGLLLGGLGLVVVFLPSVFLSYFVALRSPPAKRAGWTVGIPYLIAAVGGLFIDLQGVEIAAPLIALPGALIAFLYWWYSFRRGWIENVDDLPDGVAVEDDDWRVGLLYLALVLFIGLAVAFARGFLRYYLSH